MIFHARSITNRLHPAFMPAYSSTPYQKSGGGSMRAIFIVIMACLVLFGCTGQNTAPAQASNLSAAIPSGGGALAAQNATQGQNAEAGQNSTSVKFSDSPDAAYAYLISGETLDNNSQKAIAGFVLTRQVLPDGRINMTLKAQKAEYSDQNYVLAPGQSLYFIERYLGDDNEGVESNLRDDSAVIVDSNGYIVK